MDNETRAKIRARVAKTIGKPLEETRLPDDWPKTPQDYALSQELMSPAGDTFMLVAASILGLAWLVGIVSQ